MAEQSPSATGVRSFIAASIYTGEWICHVVALSLGFSAPSALTWVIVSDICIQMLCQWLFDIKHRRVSAPVIAVFGAIILGVTPWTDSLLLSSYVLALVIYRGHTMLRAVLLTMGGVALVVLYLLVRCFVPRRPDLSLHLRRVASSWRQEVLGANADDNCSVCTEPMVQGDVVRVLTPCMHQFHVACIQPWLQEHNTCPNCRRVVVEPEPVDAAAHRV